MHRAELLRYAHQPEIWPEFFATAGSHLSPLIQRLQLLTAGLDITEDPYVQYLRTQSGDDAKRRLQETLSNLKTYCFDQLRHLTQMAVQIDMELGGWASFFYIYWCVLRFKCKVAHYPPMDSAQGKEFKFLSDHFAQLALPGRIRAYDLNLQSASPHVFKLLEILDKEMHADSAGIVFVKTRATAGLLSVLLAIHPQMKSRLRVGTFLGTSNSSSRKSRIGDWGHTADQDETLDELRSGKKNLIICTSVIEEGIDIAACNLVVCYDAPPNLKSFIQRRGRARHGKSRYIIMMPKGAKHVMDEWQEMERTLKAMYADAARELQELQQVESSETGQKELHVQSTGSVMRRRTLKKSNSRRAKITLDEAVPHLYHYCNSLSNVQYTSMNPVFAYDRSGPSRLFRCAVTLPNSTRLSARTFTSSSFWQSGRMARADASIEALRKLYENGLLNGHLLPVEILDEDTRRVYESIEKRTGLVAADEKWSAWASLATSWTKGEPLFASKIVFQGSLALPSLTALLPARLENVSALTLFLLRDCQMKVTIERGAPVTLEAAELSLARQATHRIFATIFSSRMPKHKTGFPILFFPGDPLTDLESWLNSTAGSFPAGGLMEAPSTPFSAKVGLVRSKGLEEAPYILHELQQSQNEDSGDAPPETMLKLSKFSKNVHVTGITAPHAIIRYDTLPARECRIDRLPIAFAYIARMLPCIQHTISLSLTADWVCDHELRAARYQNRNLVLQAITSPSLNGGPHYERLEFLGDCLLKTYVSTAALVLNPTQPEGFLSRYKDHMVSNRKLAIVSKQLRLDRYVLLSEHRFKATKWRPVYNSTSLGQNATEGRLLPSKTLADVVEALLGAAHEDGGEARILDFLRLSFSAVSWFPLSESFATIAESSSPAARAAQPSDSFLICEELVSHEFASKALLLEALTDPSYLSSSGDPSYQRLEFLGDAVLDYIVTQEIYKHSSRLDPGKMTLLKFAAVNVHFLAFLVLTTNVDTPVNELIHTSTSSKHSVPTTVPLIVRRSLPDFLRQSPDVDRQASLAAARARLAAVENETVTALRSGDTYPWRLLASVAAPKLVSDLLESSLGAIAVDARGDFSACERWLEKLGLLPWLRRALAESVDAQHPKSVFYNFRGVDQPRIETKSDRVIVEDQEKDKKLKEEEASLLNDPIALLLGTRSAAARPLFRPGFQAQAFVGERLVCECEALAEDEAVITVSEEAVRILRAEDASARRRANGSSGHAKTPDEVSDRDEMFNETYDEEDAPARLMGDDTLEMEGPGSPDDRRHSGMA